MKRIVSIFILIIIVFLSGCASIVSGTKQVVFVDTSPVTGARCTLSNSEGEWCLNKTPGSVAIHRAYGPLKVICKKDGYDDVIISVKSCTKAAAFGNVLFGGCVGAGIDCANGAAYDYPQKIMIPMKKSAG